MRKKQKKVFFGWKKKYMGENVILIVHYVKAEISKQVQLRGQYMLNWWPTAWETKIWE